MDDEINLIDEIGGTAFVIAALRALESQKPKPLFEDPFAQLFNQELAIMVAQKMDEKFPPTSTMISFRTRFFDQLVKNAFGKGFRQVVLLGGGFDMRAHRFAQPNLRFYEIDKKAVIEYKSSVLKQNRLIQPPSVRCNYLKSDIIKELENLGFDCDIPTLIIWEGNTMYLPSESIFPFLNALADSIASVEIAFDFFALDVSNRELNTQRENEVLEGIEQAMNITYQNGFSDISVIAKHTPFEIVDSNSFYSLANDFGQQDAVEKYPKDWTDILEIYRYCLLKK